MYRDVYKRQGQGHGQVIPKRAVTIARAAVPDGLLGEQNGLDARLGKIIGGKGAGDATADDGHLAAFIFG